MQKWRQIVVFEPPSRWRTIGNCGSGKSPLAERVGTCLRLPIHDLDLTHWHTDGRKCDEIDARDRMSVVAVGDGWVIEGVYR